MTPEVLDYISDADIKVLLMLPIIIISVKKFTALQCSF